MNTDLIKNIFKANPIIILAYTAAVFVIGFALGALFF